MPIEAEDAIRRIWIAYAQRSSVPSRRVTFSDGSEPEANRCEQNVAQWTLEHPEYRKVHGWLAIGDPPQLQKHWMVQDEKGQLLNITPLNPLFPMFAHPGALAEFSELLEIINLVHFQHLRG
ncbi:hypothetical protein [Bradyrhizobium sp. HKCCYLS2033]|uniref:hypothetical protein n=1 Tax=Bradyrhizobium sp. HKCCYLS2033 TaxID=3420739 RepID=UPI003EBA3917